MIFDVDMFKYLYNKWFNKSNISKNNLLVNSDLKDINLSNELLFRYKFFESIYHDNTDWEHNCIKGITTIEEIHELINKRYKSIDYMNLTIWKY